MAADTLPPHPDDVEGIGLDAGDIVRLYARHIKLMLGVVVGLVALVTLMVYLVPPSYVSTAELLIARNEPDVSEGDFQRPVTALERGEVLATEAEILTSEGLVLRCLQDFEKLNAAPVETDYIKLMLKYALVPFKRLGLLYEGDDPIADRIRGLAKRVDVTEHVDANTLKVQFTHDSPEVAQRALNALIDTYLRFRIETLRHPELQAHYEEQMAGASERVDEMQGQLLELGRESGLIDPEIEVGSAVTHLMEMRNRVVDMEVDRQATAARLEEVDRLLHGREEIRVIRSEDQRNPTWLSLNEALANLERRLQVMGATYQANSEPMQRVEAELLLLRDMLAQTPEMITTSETRALDPQVAELRGERDDALTMLAMIEGRQEALHQAIDQRSNELRTMSRWVSEAARVGAERMAVASTYQVFLNKREDARLASMADKSQINIKVIKPAQRPDKPSTHRLVPIILAGIAGLALALGLATVIELFNGTVRNERDIERSLGVPMLASIKTVAIAAKSA